MLRASLLLAAAASIGWAQPAAAPPRAEAAKPAPPERPSAPEPDPVQTKHSISVNGKTLNYTVTTGRLPLRNEQTDAIEAHMFFIAYTLDGAGPRAKRPLMISFNGGPGSSSVWLHLGVIGPKRVKMNDDGSYPPPPFELVDNEHGFLEFTDLVFIDPVGTGFSRATSQDAARKFFGVQGDIASVGDFIRLFLTRYERWSSPLFLIGESYGTFRAAGLAGYLVERGIAFNGVCLISSVLNFQTIRFTRGNDLPFQLFLPTYTASAWYHKKLPADLQKDLKKALAEAEQWALTGYAEALAKGDRLSDAERKTTIDKLARLTGLDKRYLDQTDLRIEIMHFIKELLRDERKVIGRLDSRLIATEGQQGAETPGFDPSMAAIRPPYTAAFLDYVRGGLGYKSDLNYYILGGGIGQWDFGPGNNFADTSDSLRQAFAKNPHMKVFVGSGYYDLATPYFATQYTFSHMGLPVNFRPAVTEKFYEAGHMYYIHKASLERTRKDLEAFVTGAVKK